MDKLIEDNLEENFSTRFRGESLKQLREAVAHIKKVTGTEPSKADIVREGIRLYYEKYIAR